MSNIQEPIQTEAEVLANTTAIPQEFYVTKNSLSVHITGIAPAGSITTGSVVSNKLKPGSVGFVATVKSLAAGHLTLWHCPKPCKETGHCKWDFE